MQNKQKFAHEFPGSSFRSVISREMNHVRNWPDPRGWPITLLSQYAYIPWPRCEAWHLTSWGTNIPFYFIWTKRKKSIGRPRNEISIRNNTETVPFMRTWFLGQFKWQSSTKRSNADKISARSFQLSAFFSFISLSRYS